MTRQVRRVVTGHDANESAVVKIDEVEKGAMKLLFSRALILGAQLT